MTGLTHKVTGHRVRTDDASVDFWKSAGYAEDKPEEGKGLPAEEPTPAPKKSSK